MKKLILTAFSLATAFAAHAQLQPAKQTPESSELWSPVPRVVTPGKPSTAVSGFTAPSDAIVLFDGKNLDAWVSGKDGKAALRDEIEEAADHDQGRDEGADEADDDQRGVVDRQGLVAPEQIIGEGAGHGRHGEEEREFGRGALAGAQ